MAYNVYRWYETGTGRYESTDPMDLRDGSRNYLYGLANPSRFADPLGLFSIDSSCDDLECVKLKRGFALELLKQEITATCSDLSLITDASLRKCASRQCDRGRVICKDPKNKCSDPTWFAYGWMGGGGAFICKNNFPKNAPIGYLGDAVLHEWAHDCGWKHGDDKGVPYDPGKGQ